MGWNQYKKRLTEATLLLDPLFKFDLTSNYNIKLRQRKIETRKILDPNKATQNEASYILVPSSKNF